MSGCSISFETSDVLNRLDSMQARTRASLEIIARSAASAMENYAKRNARWTDRTGNARQRLKGSIRWDDEALLVVISHNVDYGMWLELCNEKKYAILKEALNSQAPQLMQAYLTFIRNL